MTPESRVKITAYFVENRLNRGFGAPEDEALLRAAVAESRIQKLPERDQAWVGSVLAQWLRYKGDIAEAKVLANQSLAVYARESYALCDQADMRVLLADIQGLEGDVAGSIPIYRQAYADFKTCSGEASENTLLTQARLARVLLKVGQGQEVIALLEPSLPVWRKAFPNSPDLSEPLVFLAKAYLQTSQFEKAEAAAEQGLQVIAGKVELTWRANSCAGTTASPGAAGRKPLDRSPAPRRSCRHGLCRGAGYVCRREAICGTGAPADARSAKEAVALRHRKRIVGQ